MEASRPKACTMLTIRVRPAIDPGGTLDVVTGSIMPEKLRECIVRHLMMP